jgi:LacI family transcriptional regulator
MTNIQDVARRANVSIATVSRVLNGNTQVNPDVAARVRAVAEELHYQPSRAARTLLTNRSQTIGLLISDIQNPFFTTLIRGVEDVAQRNGYSIILCNSDEDSTKERQYIDVLCSERVAGAIVVPTRERQKSFNLFHEHNIPIVAVDRRLQGQRVDTVLVDNVRGAYEAVNHLIQNGYRRIGIVNGPVVSTTGRERLQGYHNALREAGVPLESELERFGSFKEESGRRLAGELLEMTPPVEALFVTNNLMSLGALEALYARSLRIPEDIAIVGFDEMPWAALSRISLTTVTQPVYELGSTAAMRLLQHLQSPEPLTQQEIILNPTLRIRGSSQPRASPFLIET